MRRRVLPGFGLSLGFTLLYLGLVVLLPLSALAWKASDIGFAGLLRLFASPRTLAALKLSFGVSAVAALTASPSSGSIPSRSTCRVATRYIAPVSR